MKKLVAFLAAFALLSFGVSDGEQHLAPQGEIAVHSVVSYADSATVQVSLETADDEFGIYTWMFTINYDSTVVNFKRFWYDNTIIGGAWEVRIYEYPKDARYWGCCEVTKPPTCCPPGKTNKAVKIWMFPGSQQSHIPLTGPNSAYYIGNNVVFTKVAAGTSDLTLLAMDCKRVTADNQMAQYITGYPMIECPQYSNLKIESGTLTFTKRPRRQIPQVDMFTP